MKVGHGGFEGSEAVRREFGNLRRALERSLGERTRMLIGRGADAGIVDARLFYVARHRWAGC